MIDTHAAIAPSALARIVQCPGSVQLVAQCPPEPETDEIREGHAAHWVALRTTSGYAVEVGDETPFGVPVDADMISGARLWADSVGLYGVAEQRVEIPHIYPEHCWGTPDWRRVDTIESILRVADYKYGHRFVEVFECWQLIGYASGLLAKMGYGLPYPQEITVEFKIVQPRSYHADGPVRVWRVPARDLTDYVRGASQAACEAFTPQARTRVGPECLFCPARTSCRTLQAAALTYAEFAGLPEVINLTPAALGAELAILETAAATLEARRNGLSAQAETLLRSGQRVPNFKLQQTRTNLQWTAAPSDVVMMGQLLGVNLNKPPVLKTPLQAIEAGIDERVIAQYSKRPPGKMQLAPDDSTQARKVFGTNL